MKRFLATLAFIALTGGGLVAVMAASAGATPSTSPSAPAALCAGWYTNPDEQHRKPTQLADGMRFEGNDLVHHAASGTIEGLTPGTYTATPAPDQPSFFSVEVGTKVGETITGYATLRWNTTTSKWNMVTGGNFYEHTSPAELVKMTTPAKSSNLLSFGVGYTNSPPGTVSTKVTSVTFKGQAYPTHCAPKPSASASSKPASATPSASASGVAASLPVTGSTPWAVAGVGALLVLAGGVAVMVARRRRTRFVS